MKKYLILFASFFLLGILNVNAEANPLMQCDYNVRLWYNDFEDDYMYIKYRVVYMDDGTIQQLMPQFSNATYSEGTTTWTGLVNFEPTTFIGGAEISGSLPYTTSEFTAEDMQEYYENKSCPYFTLESNGTSYTFEPTDSNLTNSQLSIYSTNGTITLYDESGGEIIVEPPKVTTSCSFETADNSGITVEFLMYDNGDKFLKTYFTDRGDDSAQEIKVEEEGVLAHLTNDSGTTTYTIYLPQEEISNIYNQTSSQEASNTFTCPSSDRVLLLPDVEGGYTITTEKENVNPDNGLDFTTDGCSSYLGDVNNEGSPAYYLDLAFNIIKYVVIVLLFVLTIIDLAKAIPSGKPEDLKKVGVRAIKRLLIAVIVFFLPILINFVLELLGVITDNNMCGIGS